MSLARLISDISLVWAGCHWNTGQVLFSYCINRQGIPLLGQLEVRYHDFWPLFPVENPLLFPQQKYI